MKLTPPNGRPGGPRGLLPAGGPVRDERPHLQPHHGACPAMTNTSSSTRTASCTRRSPRQASTRSISMATSSPSRIRTTGNPAGYVIHGAVHAAREDVTCVIHTHSREHGRLDDGLRPTATQSARPSVLQQGWLPRLRRGRARHRGAGPRHFGPRPSTTCSFCAITAWLSAVEPSPRRSTSATGSKWPARLRIDALASGRELIVPPEEVRQKTAHQYDPSVRRTFGEMEWEAMIRRLVREGADFAE